MISVFDRKENCCGCTACKHICSTHAIEMVSDQEGFLYPGIVQKLCMDCGLCNKYVRFKMGTMYQLILPLLRSMLLSIKKKLLE